MRVLRRETLKGAQVRAARLLSSAGFQGATAHWLGLRQPAADHVPAGTDGAVALDALLSDSAAATEDAAAVAGAPLRGPHRLAATWLRALGLRCAIRTQLLLILVGLMSAAWLIGGAITVLHARQSTSIEITAAMNLAEALVHEATPMIEHSTAPKRALEAIPAQVGTIRHVRIIASDAAGRPLPVVAPRHGPHPQPDAVRRPAPGWFAALIAPPIETRHVPVVVAGHRLGSVTLTSAPGDEIAEVWENTTALAELALLFGIAAIVILHLLFARVLAPLQQLAAGLLDLERRDYKVRLRQPEVRELAVIANRFNALAAALDSMKGENKTLNKRLITAQDDERRQTALDLHDEVGPCLFGLRVNATSIAKAKDPTVAQSRAREMLEMIERLQMVNRSVLNRLRPMALGQIPLSDLLSALVEEQARQSPDMAISFAVEGLHDSYGESVDLTVYRCVQESVTNVVRHAGARRSSVALAHKRAKPGGGEDVLSLIVRDDGRGIRPGAPKGRGIQGMQERVHALDGECLLEGAAGGGTVLRVAIPLPESEPLRPRRALRP